MSSPTTRPPDPDHSATRPPRTRRWLLAALVTVVLVAAGAAGYAVTRDAPGADASSMAGRAASVMPFDLAATTHAFTDTPDGGVEQITANDPNDAANTTAIREHLAQEAAAFAAGDYRDPATIHGADMPGLAQLEAGAARVQVTYSDVPVGAQITLRSADPALVAAVHAWFAAQNSDHAAPGMGMGH